MRTPIECANCGKQCGWHYSAIINADPEDCSEAESSGIGENFVDDKGNWYCSQKCLDNTLAEELENELANMLFDNEYSLEKLQQVKKLLTSTS